MALGAKRLGNGVREYTLLGDGEIEEGQVYGFLGPNGAGKSYAQNLVIRDPIPLHSDDRIPG